MSQTEPTSGSAAVECDGTPEASHLLALILFDRCPACGAVRNPFPPLPTDPPTLGPLTVSLIAAFAGVVAACLTVIALIAIGRP